MGGLLFDVTLRELSKERTMEPMNGQNAERRKVFATTADDAFLAEVAKMNETLSKRAYELFCARNNEHGKDMQDWLIAETEFFRKVPCEVMDKGNELMIRAEVPGFNQRELQVKLDNAYVYITGHKERLVQSSSVERIFSDRESKDLFRRIELPIKVDPARVTTSLHEGILTIFVRKADSVEKDAQAA